MRYRTPLPPLEYYDDERELTIVVERAVGEPLEVHAFDADDEAVYLSREEEWSWLEQAHADLVGMAYDAADAMLNARREP
jgi:hypothetical protein